MAYTASKVIEIAKQELGYHEKASNSNLDSKTANSGNKNYQKYSRDLYNAGYYNGNKQGYAWCFTEGTLILTDNGYKNIEDIKVGDKVLNATGTRFNTITKASSHETDVIDVRVYGALPFSVTPDHPFLSQRRINKWHRNKGFKDYGFNEIASLNINDVVAFPQSPELYENNLNYNELWLLGYYVGDGYKSGMGYYMSANENKMAQIEQHMIDGLYLCPKYKSSTCETYIIKKDCSTAFKDALAQCGNGAENKKIPTFILFGNKETKRIFLDGYFTADGCVYNNKQTFNSISEELVTGISRLVFDLDMGCVVNIQHRPSQGKIWDNRYNTYRTFNQKEIIYNCSVNNSNDMQHRIFTKNDNISFVPIKEISQDTYRDIVYTLTTDGDHTYTANNIGVHNCDQFVDWCHYIASGKNKKVAEAVECQTGTLGAGCTYSMAYFKQAGRFDNKPKVGDQIFFRYSGTPSDESDHTGIVIAVSKDSITTIEGNSGNEVSQCHYPIGYSTIAGYGHPKYDAEKTTTTTTKTTTTTTKATTTTTKTTTNNTNITLTFQTLKKGSKGVQVKTLQRILYTRGFKDANGNKLSIDGDFGSKTEYAVKQYQKYFKLKQTGIVDKNTWTVLLLK